MGRSRLALSIQALHYLVAVGGFILKLKRRGLSSRARRDDSESSFQPENKFPPLYISPNDYLAIHCFFLIFDLFCGHSSCTLLVGIECNIFWVAA